MEIRYKIYSRDPFTNLNEKRIYIYIQWRTQACKNGGAKSKKKIEGAKLKKLKN
jgi:hypothetical protein